MQKTVVSLMLLGAMLAFGAPGWAQEYPAKPIKIVVPFPPGGGIDRTARIVADKLRTKWGQPVIVENHSGASGNIGALVVAKAAPDGYTLLMANVGPLVINKSLYSKLPYDSDAFVPVSLVTTGTFVLVAHPGAPASFQQLIAFAKANPDKLNYASQGSGTSAHLTSEALKSQAAVKMVHVPYKGTGPALSDLLGGQVDLLFVEFGSVLPLINAGKLRALAVASEKRNHLLPNVPAIAETLPKFLSVSWTAMAAAPGTPPAIANTLSAAIAESLKQPDVTKQLIELSIEGVGSTPQQLAQFLSEENERWGKVVRGIGAKAD